MFPFASLVTSIDKSDPERAFIVDVASGRGQSLLQIKREMEATGVRTSGGLSCKTGSPYWMQFRMSNCRGWRRW
jgi:hypothetical protein